jgi:hypothetical protein
MRKHIPKSLLHPAWLLTAAVFLLLRLTMVPGLYSLDSAEFMTAGYLAGFAHAPGYPLYTMLLHGAMHLHPGEPAFVGNLLSVWSLTLTTPFLYGILHHLTRSTGAALLATLITLLSYRVWLTGLFTEIYAPQILAIAITGYCLVRLADAASSARPDARPDRTRWQWLTAFSIGLAVTIHPALVWLGGGVLLVFLKLPLTWRDRILCGVFAVSVALLPYLYFPLRQLTADSIPYNMLGLYDISGDFNAIDFTQPGNILWLITGRQFESLFFSEGLLPSPGQLVEVGLLMFQNYAGVGLVLVLYGLVYLYRQQRDYAVGWLVFALPLMYFYTTYGAPDKELMFGGVFVLLSVPLAFAFVDLLSDVPRRVAYAFALIPLAFLLVNLPLLNQSNESAIRERTDYMLSVAPDNAILIGAWFDIAPLQYAYHVEQTRRDVSLYNVFLFKNDIAVRNFIRHALSENETVWLIDPGYRTAFFEGFYMTRRVVGESDAGYSAFTVYAFDGYQP